MYAYPPEQGSALYTYRVVPLHPPSRNLSYFILPLCLMPQPSCDDYGSLLCPPLPPNQLSRGWGISPLAMIGEYYWEVLLRGIPIFGSPGKHCIGGYYSVGKPTLEEKYLGVPAKRARKFLRFFQCGEMNSLFTKVHLEHSDIVT